jgi:hypothetical protein
MKIRSLIKGMSLVTAYPGGIWPSQRGLDKRRRGPTSVDAVKAERPERFSTPGAAAPLASRAGWTRYRYPHAKGSNGP